MSEHDFDRTARLWLEDGPSRMPDRGLDAALSTVHRTRQRRAIWPARRISSMPTLVRLAAGLAIVLVAIVGISLLPGAGIGSPQPVPRPTPTPAPSLLTLTMDATALTPGTYVTTEPFAKRLTFTVPAGWSGNIGGPYAVFLSPIPGAGEVSITNFSKVYADPCHFDRGLMNPLPGPAVDDLIAALRSVPGLTVSPATDVTISGYHGKQVTITAPGSYAGCTLDPDGAYRLWELPLGAANDMPAGGTQRLWVMDLDGLRFVIELSEGPGETAAEIAEAQAVVDSIRIFSN